MDDVISKGHWDLSRSWLIAGAATLVDAATSFANSQVLGVAAQRAITEMRKNVEAHVMRLPVRYFDSTKTGVLISRIMTDSEGIRNLVGTGLVQLTGSIFTAVFALAILLYLNWKLTLVTILVLGLFGGGMAWAFSTLRPLFENAAKSMRKSPAVSLNRSAASASSRPIRRRNAKSSCSPGAPIACSATSRSRSRASRPSERSQAW
jgi:subfamily B ATP-binding cassette protein MsbA